MGSQVLQDILGMHVAVVSLVSAVDLVHAWTSSSVGRYVCVANVHMCMETYDDMGFREVVNSADLTVPDGLPLVWAQRLLGNQEATQVRGEDLTMAICAMAEVNQVPVGFFGGTDESLGKLRAVLLERFPRLQIRYAVAPPFRPITGEEDSRYAHEINASGARILFVGLGCPKQERWMAAQRERLSVVMLGVGAAFDFIAGSKTAAPRWMRQIGLEWLYRLGTEPKRLWRRYLKHNPRYVCYVGWQIAMERIVRHR